MSQVLSKHWNMYNSKNINHIFYYLKLKNNVSTHCYSNNKKYNKCNSIQQTIYSASKNTITIMMKVSQFISTAKSDIYINTLSRYIKQFIWGQQPICFMAWYYFKRWYNYYILITVIKKSTRINKEIHYKLSVNKFSQALLNKYLNLSFYLIIFKQ